MPAYVLKNNHFSPYEGDFVRDILGGVPGPWGGDRPPNYRILKVLGHEDSAAKFVIFEAMHPDESPFIFWVNPILFEGTSAVETSIMIPTLPDLLDFLSRYFKLAEIRLSEATLEETEYQPTPDASDKPKQ